MPDRERPLTRAQRRIVNALAEGGQLWPVGELDRLHEDDGPTDAFYVLAEWYGPEWDDFLTTRVQTRTLSELSRRGLLPANYVHL